MAGKLAILFISPIIFGVAWLIASVALHQLLGDLQSVAGLPDLARWIALIPAAVATWLLLRQAWRGAASPKRK